MSAPGLRRRDARHTYEMHAGPSMTPMVDVVLVILIFFMAAAAIAGPETLLRIGVRAPASAGGGALTLPPAEFRVELRAVEGRTLVTGLGLRDGSIEALRGASAALATRTDGEGLVVILGAGDGVAFGEVVRARDAISAGGIDRIELD